MFDDRLFDIIMGEMMSTFGADVRTDEGSLAYNACAKIALKLEEVYGDMSQINDNLLVDTMDLAHLISYASERGLAYQFATAPIVKGVFNQNISIGDRFGCGDYVYSVTELIDGFSYKMRCLTEGTSANTTLGALTLVDYVDDWKGGTITEILVAGVDDEDEEEFRQKIIKSFANVAFGGNRADYRLFINGLDGVGGCKPIRRASDSPWVNVYIISELYGVPAEEVVNAVQSAVDPEENHGAGDGLAPICHSVKIFPVTGTAINIQTSVTFETGYSAETSLESIKTAINEYLVSLCEQWQEMDLESLIVRLSQIEAKILSVEGVIDCIGTTINGVDQNIALPYTEIPVLGGVVLV